MDIECIREMSCSLLAFTKINFRPPRWSFSKLCHFTYVTAHSDSPSFQSLHLRHSSFSNLSLALPTSQLILQRFFRFSYVTAHSPTIPSLYLRHSSFSNRFVASPTSQFILQPFLRFTYVTAHFTTLLSLLLRHSSFSNSSVAST